MKWLVVALAAAAGAYLLIDTSAQREATDPSGAQVRKPERPVVPMLRAGGGGPEAGEAPSAPPVREDGPPARETSSPAAKEQRASEKKAARVVAGSRKLRPGESFTPLSELVRPDEGSLDPGSKTRERLQSVKPLRTTWSDAPLQEVLQQLTKQTGLTIALGPRAVAKGKSMTVSDPFAKGERPADPSVWDVLVGLARQAGLSVNPWERGVLLNTPPDPERIALRIFDVRDLATAPWGNGSEIEAEDRLTAVFPNLVRAAADLDKGATLRMQGKGIVIARAKVSHLDRIGKAFDGWRRDPRTLRAAYRTLIATRHPTVSGAPPRDGKERKEPDASR